MGNGFPYSSCKIYLFFMTFFPRYNINNTINFLIFLYKSMVDATGFRWFLSPVSLLNLLSNPVMMYDPTSTSFSLLEEKLFLVPRRLSYKILYLLNDPAILITKASPVMIYSSLFYLYCNWDHYSNTFRGSNIPGTMGVKFNPVT